MRNLVPHFIQHKYSQGILRGQFTAAGLFVDMSGFSKMTDALMTHGPHGAEVLAQVMGKIFTPLAESVYGQGGFIAGFAGDAFTALFPQTDQNEENIARALSAAWQIQRQVRVLEQQETPYGQFTIQVKLGLGEGLTTWGIIPSPDQRRAVYYFQGEAVDSSAEAEHHAAGGQVLLSARAYEQLSGRVEVEPDSHVYRLTSIPEQDLPAPMPVQPDRSDPAIAALFYPGVDLNQARSGEFRHIVSLFINLPTVRDETQLRAFMQSVFELLDRYGGMVSRIDFGDKGSNVLLLWGMPVMYENDIERALNFILALQSMTSIPVNAGVTYQLAHAGFIGSPYLEDYTGYGRGVSLAARFMTKAARGEIWVDEPIYRRVHNLFEFDELDRQQFKGFAEPQAVYVLIERLKQSEPFFSGKMVGRTSELGQLASFYNSLCNGHYAGAMVIFGEAGMGKSRLVYEFQNTGLCRENDTLWAVCQTDEILRLPLNPFRYWLENYFQQADSQPEARNKRNFNRAMDGLILTTAEKHPELSEELDRLRSCLGALVNLYWPDSLYEELDPQGRYDNILIALIDLLLAESLNRPVVLLLEDVQWLDPATLEFLPRLDRLLTANPALTYPLAIIATSRPEKPAEILGKGLAYQRIDLSGLTDENLSEIAKMVFGAIPKPRLLRLVGAHSEGNPFYAEQICRYLLEEDHLLIENGKADLRGKAVQGLLPVDVNAILVARLDRLTAQVKNVVQTAAILGREFEVQLLTRMLKSEDSLSQDIELVTSAAIWKPLDELRYIFNHILMQNAAYNMLLVAERRILHALAVEAIETLYADDLTVHLGELAYHSDQAGLAGKASLYFEQAGEVARDVYQNQAALDYYLRALATADSEDPLRRYQLTLEIDNLHYLLGNLELQRAALHDLDDLVGEIEAKPGIAGYSYRAEMLVRWAWYYLQVGDYPSALEKSQESSHYAVLKEDLSMASNAEIIWTTTLHKQGHFEEAYQHGLQALNFAEQAGVRHEQGQALNILGLILQDKNRLDDACQFLGKSLLIADTDNDRRLQATALSNLGNIEAAEGNFSAALDYFEESIRIDREIGDRDKTGLGLINRGWIAGMLGDYPGARSYLEQNMSIARETGNRQSESFTLINLSGIAFRQGDFSAARSFSEQALSLAREIGDLSGEAWALTYLGHVALAEDEYDPAKTVYNKAIQIRQELGQPNLACEPVAGLARLALAQGDQTAALSFVRDILAYLDGGGNLANLDEPLRVYLTCYQVLCLVGDVHANIILNEAYQILQEQAAKIDDEALRRSFLENVPYHREIQQLWAQHS